MCLLPYKKILIVCVATFACSMASGMQNQQIPQDLSEMLQQHKDLTLRNKKIANGIKFVGLEALILAGGYTLLSLLPRLDSKLLGGKFLRAIKANGTLSHDIKGLGIIICGACCFSIEGVVIGAGFFKFCQTLLCSSRRRHT